MSRNQGVEVGTACLTITLNTFTESVLLIFMTLGIADLEILAPKEDCVY